MRSTCRIRQNVIGLAEFLVALYDAEEIKAQLAKGDGATSLSEEKSAFVYAGEELLESLDKKNYTELQNTFSRLLESSPKIAEHCLARNLLRDFLHRC